MAGVSNLANFTAAQIAALNAAAAAAGYIPANPGVVAPVGLIEPWFTAISAGGMIVQDAATITNPTTQITSPTRNRFYRSSLGIGTNILVRMGYATALTAITSPVIKLFGRYNSTEAWQLLKNKSLTITTTVTADTTNDVTDGTLKYTTTDFSLTAFDSLGCNEFIFGVQTILAGTGTVNTAILQAKII
jgi:hypothetical protein